MALSGRHRRVAWWAAISLIVILGGVAAGVLMLRPLVVEVVSVRRGPAVESVYASGIVDFKRQARLTAVVAAPIRTVRALENDTVRRGQLLAELVDGPEQASLLQLEAQAQLARLSAARTEELYRLGYAAKAALDNAQAQYVAAAAAARAARERLADYRIIAPFDGVIMRRDAEPGDLATPSRPLFVVADPATLRITADIDERDTGRLSVGQEAVVRSDAFPGRTFLARVDEVTPQGDSNARVFRARLALAPDCPLRAGMTVEVNIVLARRERALLIPTRAVRDGKVFILEGGRARARAVVLGVRSADVSEVTAGLNGQETLVVDPPQQLKDGARVSVRRPAR